MNQTTHARQGEGMLDWMEGAPTLIDEEVRSSKSVCVYLQGKTMKSVDGRESFRTEMTCLVSQFAWNLEQRRIQLRALHTRSG
jgi:hypothetical protein